MLKLLREETTAGPAPRKPRRRGQSFPSTVISMLTSYHNHTRWSDGYCARTACNPHTGGHGNAVAGGANTNAGRRYSPADVFTDARRWYQRFRNPAATRSTCRSIGPHRAYHTQGVLQSAVV